MSELVAESLATLTNYSVGDATLDDFLNRVAELTIRTIPQASFAGVTIVLDGRVGTHASTDAAVPEIDSEQYRTGEGPGVHAFRNNETAMIASTVSSDRWRSFCAVASDHGVMSTLSIPMTTSHATVGTLNLYATVEHAFDTVDIDAARSFATQAGYLLSNAQAYWDARHLSENLTSAMVSRADIEQAKGIIIATTGCTPGEAFEQLRAQSQHENVKLRDIASRIVADAQRRRHPSP